MTHIPEIGAECGLCFTVLSHELVTECRVLYSVYVKISRKRNKICFVGDKQLYI